MVGSKRMGTLVARGLVVARSALTASLLIGLVACSGGTQLTQTSGSNTGSPGLAGGSGATGPPATGVTGSTAGGTTGDNAACQLLTQDLVEQALGTTVDPGTPQATPFGGSSCAYFDAADTAGATLVVIPAPNGATYYDPQKAAAQDPQNDTGFFHEISGLGDDAFTDGINVTVLSGGASLGLVAFAANQHAGDTSTAEALLATILGRL